MRKILSVLVLLAVAGALSAQDSTAVASDVEATGLRAEGKIYVVLVVSVTILIGLFIYLIRLDRKITKLEKDTSAK